MPTWFALILYFKPVFFKFPALTKLCPEEIKQINAVKFKPPAKTYEIVVCIVFIVSILVLLSTLLIVRRGAIEYKTTPPIKQPPAT